MSRDLTIWALGAAVILNAVATILLARVVRRLNRQALETAKLIAKICGAG